MFGTGPGPGSSGGVASGDVKTRKAWPDKAAWEAKMMEV